MTATFLLGRRYLTEYARRPLNLVLLVVVPLIFVSLASGAIADFAEIVGGVADASQLSAPTAGWAAAFLAGVAGFFHVLGSREADGRLSMAGMAPARIVAARLGSGVVLSGLAVVTSLGTLAATTGIADPMRAIAGTTMFALIYLGIGVAIGASVKSDVNGSLIVIFVWMLDVFLGPAMAGSDVLVTRVFPSHFVTLVMLDAASGHSGPVGDLGWALAWVVIALGSAAIVFSRATGRRSRGVRSGGHPALTRIGAGLRSAFREYRRNIALWVLLVLLPIFFITLSFAVTPPDVTPIQLTEGGRAALRVVSMVDVHGAIMVPITVGFIAGLAGLFVVQGSLQADARLVLAGFKPREILASRLGVIAFAGILTTAVSLGVTAIDFSPENWLWFAAGNLAVALTYGLIGVLVGAVFGKLGGLYVMFLLPFIDVGIAQNVMFSAAPPTWGSVLPAHGAVRILVDAAFTSGFDQAGSAWLALGWMAALAVATALVFRRVAAPRRT